VSIQIIHHQSNLGCLFITQIKHLLDLQCPVFFGAMFSDRNVSFAGKRLHFHEYFCHSIPDVLVINPRGLTGFARYWIADFANHLLARFIHAYHRVIRIIRQMIDVKNIFHVGYKGRAPFRWDFPVFAEVRLKFVFFKTRCTVMCDTDSAKRSSTALSASNRTVHRWRPSGAAEQANAINLASNAPSKMTSRGGFSSGLRSRAVSMPSSTNRFLRCSMERLLTPSAVATSATFHAGPPAPASHNSKARAWMNRLACIFPRRVISSSSLRSSLVSVTRYLGDMTTSIVELTPRYHIYNIYERTNVTWY